MVCVADASAVFGLLLWPPIQHNPQYVYLETKATELNFSATSTVSEPKNACCNAYINLVVHFCTDSGNTADAPQL